MNQTLNILKDIVNRGHKLTPMMEQYYEIKQNFPDTLLLFRMGDFYEVFFDDAKQASKILNIALTHRGKIADIPIPMAGIPHHAAHTYVDRITNQGLKVAICEQIEDPKMAKGIVKRAVTQIASPGMPYDLDKTEKTENKFMASAIYQNDSFSLCFVDFTTGDFFGLHLKSEEEVIEQIALYTPKEFISYLGQWEKFPKLSGFLERESLLKTYLSQEYFLEKFTRDYIQRIIPNYERDEILKLDKKILIPIGALAYYIYSTQSLEMVTHIQPFRLINQEKFLRLSYPTLIGLELLPKNRDTYKDSLLGHFDKTLTSMGSRGLRKLFLSPLMDVQKIQKRQAAIQYFLKNHDQLLSVRETLKDIRDLERIMAKVSSRKANAGDLINLAQGLNSYTKLIQLIPKSQGMIWNEIKVTKESELAQLAVEILAALNDEIGASLDKGNLIKVGFNKKRDRLAKISQNVAEELSQLETKYREATGISNLKIKSNNINGFFIEVSKSHLKKVPKDFERRQTLVNNERYITEELVEFEKEILLAKDHLYGLEKEIFDSLNHQIQTLSSSIHQINESLALCDSLQALSWVAKEEKLVAPTFSDKKLFDVQGAWHPLIKTNIKEQFVTHHLKLDESVYFGLITGPNMAGKTTVMREVAIIQFLAQIGSYVPAASAQLGICDYMFSRLGASDDILRGQSTFMVEMAETAEIIRHATDKSLIILDEIGRGTSTFDGLSIAWALVEYLNEKTQALTLFSTHYHELIDLVSSISTAKNLTVKTTNENGKVQFLYTLIEEGATQSFGIYVAQLAGLPKEILRRSGQILKRLEKTSPGVEHLLTTQGQLDFLSSTPVENTVPEYLQELEKNIQNIDIMNTTPLDALKKLDDLKQNLIRH